MQKLSSGMTSLMWCIKPLNRYTYINYAFALAALNANNTKTRVSEPYALYQKMIPKSKSLS